MALKDDGVRLTLEVVSNGGEARKVQTRSKRRILDHIQASVATECKEFRLRVNYMIPQREIVNEGVYKTKKDLLFAYRAFTNNSEVKFAKNYWR